MVSRAEALVMRMAMISALTDCSAKIQVPHLQAALAIWDYCEASAAFIFGDSLGNPLAERVLQMLQEAGDRGMALAAIYKGLSGHATNEELHPALKDLHSQGLARFEKVKTSGRPGQVWFATKAARERSDQKAKKPLDPQPSVAPAKEDLSSLNSLNSPEGQWQEVL